MSSSSHARYRRAHRPLVHSENLGIFIFYIVFAAILFA
jgi:hypothetical protein